MRYRRALSRRHRALMRRRRPRARRNASTARRAPSTAPRTSSSRAQSRASNGDGPRPRPRWVASRPRRCVESCTVESNSTDHTHTITPPTRSTESSGHDSTDGSMTQHTGDSRTFLEDRDAFAAFTRATTTMIARGTRRGRAPRTRARLFFAPIRSLADTASTRRVATQGGRGGAARGCGKP